MVSTDLLAIESWDFTDKRHGEKNTGLDDSCQNQLLEDHPNVVKWAKNLARTLLPLDGRWVLDETSDTQCLIWVGEENEETSGGPEPILVAEIEPEGEGPVENPSACEPSGSSSPKRVEPEKQWM